MHSDRGREIACAILDGGARHADIAELARSVLARPDARLVRKAAALRLYQAIARHTGAELSADICEAIVREAMSDQPEARPLTDAELQTLAGLAAVEECIAQRANHVRAMQGHAAAYGEDWESDATKRLRAELISRGVLP